MRRTFVYCFLGLVSVGPIAGCGSIRDFRAEGSDVGLKSGSAPGEWSTCQAEHPASASADVQTTQGRSGVAWFEIVEEATPPHPQAIVTAKQLTESAPASGPVGPAAIKQIENVQPLPMIPGIPVETYREIVPEKEKTAAIQSLAGRVLQFRNTWRLRYAPIDQEDLYGGVVILDGGAELSQLRDGQHARVSGVLVPPESRTGSARYRVQAIEMLD